MRGRGRRYSPPRTFRQKGHGCATMIVGAFLFVGVLATVGVLLLA